uniref:Uncharacterized protein n=1 Tax=Oryza rufipogon TaxID=4529 RepID=A0A0E0QIG6_ORYRU
MCDPSCSVVTHNCRVTLFCSTQISQLTSRYRTTSFISIQGADVDPDGYAKAAGNLKAQGKT